MQSSYEPDDLLKELEETLIKDELKRRVQEGKSTPEEAANLARKLGVEPRRLGLEES